MLNVPAGAKDNWWSVIYSTITWTAIQILLGVDIQILFITLLILCGMYQRAVASATSLLLNKKNVYTTSQNFRHTHS